MERIEIDGAMYTDAAGACEILGVKPATLYAYVSRGRVRSYQQGNRRQKLYNIAELTQSTQLHPSGPGPMIVPLPDAADWMPYSG